ncbi:hypothetical protein Shyhy02_70640 [Streptomyces hygroscopicus subsp. hygroscopicus]|nr:hypothetical protein Shyhy02_70640 [Streptomyces hygroscopicus subsp. hygroscopicus]
MSRARVTAGTRRPITLALPFWLSWQVFEIPAGGRYREHRLRIADFPRQWSGKAARAGDGPGPSPGPAGAVSRTGRGRTQDRPVPCPARAGAAPRTGRCRVQHGPGSYGRADRTQTVRAVPGTAREGGPVRHDGSHGFRV